MTFEGIAQRAFTYEIARFRLLVDSFADAIVDRFIENIDQKYGWDYEDPAIFMHQATKAMVDCDFVALGAYAAMLQHRLMIQELEENVDQNDDEGDSDNC